MAVEDRVTQFPLIPEKTALINVDMQVAFVDGRLWRHRVAEVCLNRLAAACRRAGMTAIHAPM